MKALAWFDKWGPTAMVVVMFTPTTFLLYGCAIYFGLQGQVLDVLKLEGLAALNSIGAIATLGLQRLVGIAFQRNNRSHL